MQHRNLWFSADCGVAEQVSRLLWISRTTVTVVIILGHFHPG